MNQDLLNKIKLIKEELAAEGYLIEGIFGSFSRGENTSDSDLDLLIELSGEFKDKYKGYKAISKMDSIEKYISEYLNLKIDAVQMNSLNEIAKRYIIPEVYYV